MEEKVIKEILIKLHTGKTLNALDKHKLTQILKSIDLKNEEEKKQDE